MKDIIISPKRQKTELKALLVCFILAFALNIGAIIYYKTPASEIITSIFYVITFAVVLYAAWVIVRLIVYLIRRIFKKN